MFLTIFSPKVLLMKKPLDVLDVEESEGGGHQKYRVLKKIYETQISI